MDERRSMVCVILAGGKGTRMASSSLHKVCFPVAGRAAIIRAIDVYKAAGFRNFLVVVGPMAEQIMATVAAAHPEVNFVFQSESRGTGHAALVAAGALAAQDYSGGVAIVMGDKVARPSVMRRLLERYRTQHPDALVSTLPKSAESTAGRLVLDGKGRVMGVVEVADIARARKSRHKIRLGAVQLSAEQIEQQSTSVNASMYIFDFHALLEALTQLRPDNAKGELYLTDTVKILAPRGRVDALLIPDSTDLMAYNTPAELLAIEEVIRQTERPSRVSVDASRRMAASAVRTAQEWMSLFDEYGSDVRAALARIYGADVKLLDGRRAAVRTLVRDFIRQFGAQRRMLLCRAPGCLNLMGRHVNECGGHVNVMAIHREVLLAAAPREDDCVRLRNRQAERFPEREFRIADLLRDFSWSEWMDFLASKTLQNVRKTAPGDWSHYARAPLLRLQHECRDLRLKGMDCLVSGDIPMGAGLSSSSALVVAFAQAAVALNGLNVALRDFVDLCGEGEWFTGSREGSAEHAAISSGRLGGVTRIGFFPFRLEGEVPFPRDLRVVIAASGHATEEGIDVEDVARQRAACYLLAQRLLERVWPVAAGVRHLRDLSPEYLKIQPADLYQALLRLPEYPRRAEIAALFPVAERPALEEIFATHRAPSGYDLRGVTLFGISECLRSAKFLELLGAGDLACIRRFMCASHDGDRRFRSGATTPLRRMDRRLLDQMAAANAPLEEQSGRYACSVEPIDRMVDIALATDGVVGAQMAGAGFGGCIMALVRSEHISGLFARLRKEYYVPRRIPFSCEICHPVAGAGLLEISTGHL